MWIILILILTFTDFELSEQNTDILRQFNCFWTIQGIEFFIHLEHNIYLFVTLNHVCQFYRHISDPFSPGEDIYYKIVPKVIMQGKLFQRCTHLLYYSVLSLGGNVNTRRMSKPDMGSIFHIKNQWNILVRKLYATANNFPWIIALIVPI